MVVTPLDLVTKYNNNHENCVVNYMYWDHSLLFPLLEHTAYPYLNKAVLHARQQARKLRNTQIISMDIKFPVLFIVILRGNIANYFPVGY